uniref:Delta(24)-sterol reductase n=1 Tax=Clastoptera arizonana TaxID=38151 RepID=A0A1B6C9D4_9HEMI
MRKLLLTFLEQNRGLVVLLFCLPASLVFSLFLKVIQWIELHIHGKKSHESLVRQIQADVVKWSGLESKKLLCTSRKNWLSLSTKFFQKNQFHQIEIPLFDILSIDINNRSVKVEPMVTVDCITKYLIPKGFSLAVHLEIADATLGGLALGVGMTTHSHKVGLYQESILSMDVVLADGRLVQATKFNQYSDLFRSLPWSHGSLGFLVALELQIIPVKKYVLLDYIPVKGQKKYCDMIREISGYRNKNKITPDFLEATVYSKSEAVIMTGHFSDGEDNIEINRVTKWYKPWFYKHVESFLQKGRHQELIPLKDYLLRHNRSIFWVVESMIPFGNNCLFRFLFGWLLPPKVAFLKFSTTSGIRNLSFTRQVFQDIVLPISKLEEQINICDQLFNLYPLLIYPCKIFDWGQNNGQIPRPEEKELCPGTNWAMFNDLGIYGVPGYVKNKLAYNPSKVMRKIENFTRSIGGYAFLYADIFMTFEEFCQMFDLTLYEKVRKKYKAECAFPHLYDKVKPEINVIDIGNQQIIG